MPFKRTVLPNGFVLIDSYDITSEEELQMFKDFGGVTMFPSANHRSQLKNKKAVSSDTNDVSSGESHDKEN